jgi:hypothetical protein
MGTLDEVKIFKNQVYFTRYLSTQFIIVAPRVENRLKRKATFSMDMTKYSRFLEGRLDIIFVDHSIRVMAIFDHLQVKSTLTENTSDTGIPIMVGCVKELYDSNQYKAIRKF